MKKVMKLCLCIGCAVFVTSCTETMQNLDSLSSLNINIPTLKSENAHRDSVEVFTKLPAPIHSKNEMHRLFAKRTVSGSDLRDEILQIKKDALRGSVESSFDRLLGTVNQAKLSKLNSDPSFTAWIMTQCNLEGALEEVLKNQLVASIDYNALDQFFDFMLADKESLDRETITLPDPARMSLKQQQRVLNVAALTIGARVAKKVVDEADETFKDLKGEYKKILQQREEIAGVLADVLNRRNKALQAKEELEARQMTAELHKYFSKEDVKFLESFDGSCSTSEFAQNFAMQNLAIRYLQRKNPERYKEYRTRVDRAVGMTKVALQTAKGGIAFGGLTTGFVFEMKKLSKTKNTLALVGALPLGTVFVSAAFELGGEVADVACTGITYEITDIFFGAKRFLVKLPGEHEELRDSSDVFKHFEGRPAKGKFQQALFKNNGHGLLMNLYLFDAETVGRMLDTSVSSDLRQKFGVRFMRAPEDQSYFFVNSLSQNNSKKRRRLVSNVLSHDQRSGAHYKIVGEVQSEAAAHFAHWGNTELTRMILANHHGSVDYAQMQVGEVNISLIPSMTAVYEYECFQDALRRKMNRSAKL